MFSRIATIFTFLFFVLPFLASAVALEARGGGGGGTDQCNTGSIQCCNSVADGSSTVVSELLGTLGLNLGSITGQVGLTCSQITAVGAGGNSCSTQPVCCTGNSFGGGGLVPSLLVLGCSPINLNL